MKILLVDDESPARQLERHLLRDMSAFEIVGEANDGFEAFLLIRELKPDIVLLDVQMPRLTGFELLEMLEQPPVIVFATAYDQFALKAFDAGAADYLLKPFSKDRFRLAMERAAARLRGEKRDTSPEKEVLRKVQETEEQLHRIVVKWRDQIHVIAIDAVTHFEADGDYIKIHTPEGSYLKETTLKSLEAKLNPRQFVRVHRSSLVRLDAIEKIEPTSEETWLLTIKGGTTAKVSAEGRKKLRAFQI